MVFCPYKWYFKVNYHPQLCIHTDQNLLLFADSSPSSAQTPHWGNMCLCLWLQNISPRLTIFQTQQSSTGAGLCVRACGTAVDWYCCQPQDCSHLQGLPLYAPFLPFSILHSFFFLKISCYSLLCNPSFSVFMSMSSFFFSLFQSRPTLSLNIVLSGFRLCSLTLL